RTTSVHWSRAAQLTGWPPTQPPATQVSFVVQALPSSQETVLGVWTQPDAELQESLVQTLLSSQLGGSPPTHAPPLHVSFVVQALPSSQETVLVVWTQPDIELP